MTAGTHQSAGASRDEASPRAAGLRVALLALLAATITCASPPPPLPTSPPTPSAQGTWHYHASLSDDLAHMQVQVCFGGDPPRALRPQMNDAADALLDAEAVAPDGERTALPMRDGVIDLGTLAPGACAHYVIAVSDLVASRWGWGGRDHRRWGQDLTLSPDYWIWTSPRRPVGRTVTATIAPPDGVSVVVPWEALPDGSFRLPDSTWSQQSAGAILRSPIERVTVAGNTVTIGILGDGWEIGREALRRWIEEVTRAVALLWGEFPVDRTQVLILPTSGDEVGFGSATRGGGPAVTIDVGRQISERALMTDWTAFHELLHLGIPHLPRADSWLDEGLATYYEPVVRVRAGLMSARAAFEKLHDGFRRGEGSQTGRTLRAESAAMFDTYAFWAVYWSGAAIALIADVELRTSASSSLDAQMQKMRACCLADGRTWQARDLLDASSLGAESPHLGRVAERYLDGTDFPDLTSTYERLGLRFDATGKLLTRPGDPGAELRVAIMGRDVEP